MGFAHYLMKSGHAKLAFDLEMSPDQFGEWQTEVQTKLEALLSSRMRCHHSWSLPNFG
ncbi:TPA: hypothetical protein DCE37_01280 [Candidatus Latescibacteria bacterium]|nr:hypothetical protein [Candidatus Latescibacterota bacterium]